MCHTKPPETQYDVACPLLSQDYLQNQIFQVEHVGGIDTLICGEVNAKTLSKSLSLIFQEIFL